MAAKGLLRISCFLVLVVFGLVSCSSQADVADADETPVAPSLLDTLLQADPPEQVFKAGLELSFVVADENGEPLPSGDPNFPEFRFRLSVYRNEGGSRVLFFSGSNATSDGMGDCATWSYGTTSLERNMPWTVAIGNTPDGVDIGGLGCDDTPVEPEPLQLFTAPFTLTDGPSADSIKLTPRSGDDAVYLTMLEPPLSNTPVTVVGDPVATTAAPVPPPTAPARPLIAVEPAVVASGDTIDLIFATSPDRGGYFYLYRWTNDGWSQPTHLVESNSNGQPGRVYVAGEDVFEVEDYGVVGPGPDTIVVPDLEVGAWKICETNDSRNLCGQFEVAAE